MNKGIAKAQGEYLNFMNSGDKYASNMVLSEIFSISHTADILYGYMMRGVIDGKVNNASMMKYKIKWYDFYSDTFPHQSSYIKRNLFEKIGLYDESYKALADWKFFICAVIYNNASYEFLPLKVSIYECNGISDSKFGLIERDRLRNEMFPQMIMDDVHKIIMVDTINQFRLTRVLFRILRRCAYSLSCRLS